LVPPSSSSAALPGQSSVADSSSGGTGDDDMDAALARMEGHIKRIKAHQPIAAGSAGPAQASPASGWQPQPMPTGPVQDSDLDDALSRMENHLQNFKAHKPAENAQPHWDPSTENVADPPDMPHWEHHKYGHHEITTPAWHAQNNIQDMYGQQHSSAEYGYSTYGAGSHGHHLAHYHLNDYQGLAHHSFQAQEYQKTTFGDASHHGHWVPHLHGLGTTSHHGEHAYKTEEYDKQTFGDAAHHGHWVPHLHHLGQVGSSSQPSS